MTSVAMRNARANRKLRTSEVDALLLLIGLALLAFGLLMVTSASLHLGDRIGNPFYYSWKHLFSIFIGFTAGLIIMQVHSSQWQRYSAYLYVIGLVLLVLVLVD